MADGKDWAHKHLIDPLTAPDPSEETGPGSHFRSTFAPASPAPASRVSAPPGSNGSSLTTNNPFRQSSTSSKDGTGVGVRQTNVGSQKNYSSPVTYTSLPTHTSPPTSSTPRQVAFAEPTEVPSRERRSLDQSSSPATTTERRRSRGGSLSERFPGDKSHHPLDMLKHDEKAARRAPHLTKKHLPGADVIDKLDVTIGGAYHHEGPFDAASLARNTSFTNSPLAALSSTNEEALRATPQENIQDALKHHRPLEGTAYIPPGEHDRFGRTYEYQEGENMMIEHGGDYKRWPGVDYRPGDEHGQGEPAYSLERAMKEHRLNEISGDSSGIELTERPRKSVDHRDPIDIAGGQQNYADWEHEARRSDSTPRRVSDGLKKRIGSLRRSKE